MPPGGSPLGVSQGQGTFLTASDCFHTDNPILMANILANLANHLPSDER